MNANGSAGQDQTDFKIEDADSYNAVVDYFDRYTERFTAHMPEPLLALANAPGNGRVLDVGTGTGIIALHVAAQLGPQGRVVGIDLSDGMLATAASKAARQGLQDRVEFLKMDAENLEFPDNSFDSAISLYALRHFPNPDRSVREIYRVLKPGAAVVIAVGSPPALLSVDGVKAAFRRVASMWRKSTGRELQACEFIDALVEKYIPERKDRDVAEWVEHQHGFSGSIRELVAQAGFVKIRGGWRGQYSQVESAEDFWLLQMTFSSIARKRLQHAEHAAVDALKREFYRSCEAVLARQGRLVYQTGAAIVAARKPGL